MTLGQSLEPKKKDFDNERKYEPANVAHMSVAKADTDCGNAIRNPCRYGINLVKAATSLS